MKKSSPNNSANSTNVKAVLFDLDGTLLDTARDMIAAINKIRISLDMAEMEYDKLRPFVSHGGIAMVREGLNIKENHPDFDERKQQFLNIYKDNIANETRLFPGMDIVIDALDKKNIPWGIVTNKPEWLTHPLLKKLNLNERSKVTICGDTLPQRKPDPTPLLHACNLIGIEPNNIIYIGDAERDIEAGINAGIRSYIAEFGYIGSDDDIDSWNADGKISSPEEILEWINT